MTKTYTGLAAVGIFALVIALWAAILGVLAFILTWAWNLVVPSTFNGPTLDFGAAFAILVILAVVRAILR